MQLILTSSFPVDDNEAVSDHVTRALSSSTSRSHAVFRRSHQSNGSPRANAADDARSYLARPYRGVSDRAQGQ